MKRGYRMTLAAKKYYRIRICCFGVTVIFSQPESPEEGDVLLAVRNSLNFTKLDLDFLNNRVPGIDIVGCKIAYFNTELYAFMLYIPPSINVKDLEEFLSVFLTVNYLLDDCKILLCGDFNIQLYNLVSNYTKSRLVVNYASVLNITQQNSVLNANGRLLT